MATIPAGEVRDPQRSLPRALLIAIVVVAILYIMIQVVCVGTLPGLAQSQKPLADAGSQFLGAAGGAIISAGAIISITGNLNILCCRVRGCRSRWRSRSNCRRSWAAYIGSSSRLMCRS